MVTTYSLTAPAPIRPDAADDLHGPEAVAAFLGWPVAKAERALDLGLIPCRRVGLVMVARRSRLRAIFDVRAAA